MNDLIFNTSLSNSQYAAVMGLTKELKLHGDEFSNTATSFFIAYLIAEIPNGTPLRDNLRSAYLI